METYFEIVDDEGVVNSPQKDLTQALEELDMLKSEGFTFKGDVKVVQVHHIE